MGQCYMHLSAAEREEVKAALTGHLCRCGTHDRILRAVARASGEGTSGRRGA